MCLRNNQRENPKSDRKEVVALQKESALEDEEEEDLKQTNYS